MPFLFLTGETLLAGLAVLAFLAGGIANATGNPKIRESFNHLGFPGWWCWVTAVLEIAVALLLAFPATRIVGACIGALIMLVAIGAILRARLPRKLPPPLIFLALLGLVVLTSQS